MSRESSSAPRREWLAPHHRPLPAACIAVGMIALAACGSEPAGPSRDALGVVPGLEGFGTTTVAGRGGAVHKVTTLADDGPGSLRAALSAAGPRVVVFEVSGTIMLRDRLEIDEPFVTVAGQTAPAPGITLRGAPLRIETHDVLLQHVRIRTVDDPGGLPGNARDGLQIHGREVYNVVVDHVSVSWAIDENVSTSTSGTRRDITIARSIIAEALSHSLHPEGEHSKGLLIGEGTGSIAIVRTLLAHNRDRNPYGKGGTSVLFVNNVVYNWGRAVATFFDGGGSDGPQRATVVGNVYLAGPDTPAGPPIKLYGDMRPSARVYVADNTLNRDPAPTDGWALVDNDAGSGLRAAAPPIWTPLTVLATEEVEGWVLAHAGAWPSDRDAVDARVIAEVLARTGRIIDSPSEVGGWPVLAERVRPLTLPENPTGDDDGDGYTNLEEWLHHLAAEVERR